jgi:hypothetical protein
MPRLPLCVVGALALLPRLAWAQPASGQAQASDQARDQARDQASDQDRALAATLFDDGHALLAQGKVPEACRKLEESWRLDPLPGTALNLAVCHEREGLTASAMAEFREARAMAVRGQRADRVAFADEQLRALMPRLSMLIIVVPAEADLPALTVKRDGIVIGRAAWGTRIPVDPGPHLVEANAPGKRPQRIEVRVGPAADVQTVTLAPPDEAPAEAETSASSSAALAPALAARPSVETPVETLPPSSGTRGLGTQRVVALVAGAVGVVGIGVGTVFGVTAISEKNTAEGVCPARCSHQDGVNDWRSATSAGNVSTVAFVVGGSALAGAAVLWLTAPSNRNVGVGIGPGTLQVQGSW